MSILIHSLAVEFTLLKSFNFLSRITKILKYQAVTYVSCYEKKTKAIQVPNYCEENKHLTKLESITKKLTCGENFQNRQLQTWLCENE